MYESIDSLSSTYSVSTICSALDVNRSSYLYWLNHRKKSLELKAVFYQEIIRIYADSGGIYGAPKIRFLLNKNGFSCSVSTVYRAMVVLGIRSIVSKRFPKRQSKLSDNERALIVNRTKDLFVNRINQVWTTDITYIHTIYEGTFYLITFIDLFSKKVVAWGLFKDQKADKIVAVLDKAVKSRKPGPGLICHSDKGSQLRSKLYRDYLKKHNFVFSYTSLHHSCDENPAQESFHSLIKKEFLYQQKIYTFEDAYRVIFDYIEGFYNPIRIHSSLGYLSPNDFENQLSM